MPCAYCHARLACLCLVTGNPGINGSSFSYLEFRRVSLPFDTSWDSHNSRHNLCLGQLCDKVPEEVLRQLFFQYLPVAASLLQ